MILKQLTGVVTPMHMRYILALALLVSTPAMARANPAARSNPAAAISQARLKADVVKLVSFGTRHTMSSPDGTRRGIGAARRWATQQFEAINARCHCLEIVHPEDTVTGKRIPKGVMIQDVVAIQRGTERPDHVTIIEAHIDSRVTDVMNSTSNAPGANDDGSGDAVVLEAARVLSQHKYPTTIVYSLNSGEEQGLYGGKLLAHYVQKQGWVVKAVLNNDIVGNSCGSDGTCDSSHVRVFSEGLRADADKQMRERIRYFGGVNDSPSRNLSRWIHRLAADHPGGIKVRQIWRVDRMGRGGDQMPFQELGYPAIRFTSAVENYHDQHQDVRNVDGIHFGDTVSGMDFAYLAKVARLNVLAIDKLAQAPMPPVVKIHAIMRPDTMLDWSTVKGATSYVIWRRRTDVPDWTLRLKVKPDKGVKHMTVKLTPDRGDDWMFGVSSVAASGVQSPVSSAVPGGGFYPLASGKD